VLLEAAFDSQVVKLDEVIALPKMRIGEGGDVGLCVDDYQFFYAFVFPEEMRFVDHSEYEGKVAFAPCEVVQLRDDSVFVSFYFFDTVEGWRIQH